MTSSVLVETLRDPARLRKMDAADWERLVFECGACELGARLIDKVEQAGLADLVPQRAADHFAIARRLSDWQHAEIALEVAALRRALCSHGLPFMLLKGGAYVVGGLCAGQGRTLSDIDILVQRSDLVSVEERLEAAGWIYVKRDTYDQNYYRRWMHELPPMMHIDRHSILDVHHTVTPPTSAMAVEGARIFERGDFGGATGDDLIGLPMPADMVLHSAVHLFNDSEFEAGLRDLTDLDLLMREFGAESDFWPGLLSRAEELGLTSSLYFAVTLARDLFSTPIPPESLAAVERLAPGWATRALLSRLFKAVLSPPSRIGDSWGRELATFALYVRGHGLRMPPSLLLPHLVQQAIRRSRMPTGEAAQA